MSTTTARNAKRESKTRNALIWAVTVSLAAATVVGWTLGVAGSGEIASPIHLPWPVLAAAFALGHFAAVRLEYRNESHSLNLADAFLLPAIAFTSMKGVVLAATVGYLVRAVWVRQSVIKAAFNLALHAFVAVVALVVYHGVIDDQSVLSARGWLAGALAILVADLISSGAIQLVVGLSAGRGALTGLRRFSATLAITLVAEATIGLVAVHMITAGAVPAALFAVTAVTIALGYVVHGRLRARHAHLTQLYQFDRALAGLVERSEVTETVLGGMISLFNAAEAQLITVCAEGFEHHTMRAGDGEGATSSTSKSHPLADVLPEVERTTRVTRHTTAHGLGAALQKIGMRDAIIAPIGDQPHPTEWLVVADRLGGHHVTFEDADVELLDALSTHVTMALRSSRLLDQLRDEVTAKQHQAHHDGLTGLPNRTLYTAALDQAVAERAPDSVVGVLLMDLDGFKSVNDTMGHDVGDLLLQQLAARLEPVVADRGLIARLGGDEFAVVVRTAGDVAELELLAEKLATAAETTATIRGEELRVEASVGVAAGPEHGEDRSTLLRRADTAMYQAKRRGSRVAVYDPHGDPELMKPSFVSALREAVDARALELAYQPKADLQTGRVVGVEALLRWNHPVYGEIGGEQAIPVAERSGLIRTVTRWALDTSLAQLRRWQHDHDLTLGMAVNLSPLQLADQEIADEVVALLRAHGIAPASLTLELTESVSAGRPADDAEVAIRLANHGVRLSIDDFGTGASSLARLMALPVHELKVDKSFISELDEAASTAAIVRSTVELAHRLGIDVVAEGVETRASWRALRQMRCDYAQGYLISPPLPAAGFLEWLLRRPAEPATSSNVIPLDWSTHPS